MSGGWDRAADPSLARRKTALRQEVHRLLLGLAPEDRADRSRRLTDRLIGLPEWESARRVLLFAPLADEPNLDLLWRDGCLEGKLCFYPRTAGDELEILPVTVLGALQTGRWKLREPSGSARLQDETDRLDLILVPGMAFSATGERLGRGRGYYDRFLAAIGAGPTRVGIAFAFQLVPEVPVDAHDARMDIVLTD